MPNNFDPDKDVLYTDDKAATYKTGLSGWVSRRGFYFGDNRDSEHLARYDGCTHVVCKYCGKPAKKGYLACDSCRAKKAEERYFNLQLVDYDDKSMLYSQVLDKFFVDMDNMWEYLYDNYPDDKYTDTYIQLVLCEPVYLRPVDEEYWCDCFPTENDYDLPDEVNAALDKLNDALIKAGPASWQPSHKRVTIENENKSS